MDRRTIIVNYQDFTNVGGIEKYIYQLAIFCKDNGIRFIWLCEYPYAVAQSFKDILLSDAVERVKVNTRDYHWFKHEKIHFEQNESAIIVSFDPIGMIRAEQLMLEYPQVDIQPIYAVPDTTGNGYYLERFFTRKLNSFVKAKMKRIVYRWEQLQALRFFAATQITALENNYGVEVALKEEKVIKPVFEMKPLDEKFLENRAIRDEFNIITVSRFDFPHKGYLLGLIRAYGRLKEKYPQIKLTIIGFGDGAKLVDAEIEKLSDQAKRDLLLVGEVSPLKLSTFFEKAHLNIGVSGAVIDGARCGVISVPARNWHMGECEAYGFLHECRSMTTASTEGIIIDKFIEKTIEMSDSDYKEHCIKSYNIAKVESDPLYFWNTCNLCKKFNVNRKEIAFVKYLSYTTKVIARLKNKL